MPFRSEKQRRFLWAEHPDIARRWADEYPLNGKKLPMYAKDKAENSGEKTPENEADVIKAAKDILKRIKMPTNTGPTYAGQTDISSEQASTSILDENTPKTEETAGLNKCGMIPATSNAQRWENEKARNEGRPAQRISAVPGVKRQAVPSIYNPLPMALTQQSANSATKPAAVQSATPSNDAANRLMKDTIGSFGPIAANGNLNGNAAFGVKNSPNSSKTSSHHAAEKSARISAPMCPCGCNEKSYNCTCPKWCVCRNPGMPCAPKKRKTTPPKNQEKSAAPFAWNQTLINDLLQSNKLHRNLNTAVSTVSPMLLNSIGKRLGFGVGPALSMGANLGHAGVAHGLNTQQKMLQAFQIPDANTGTVKQNSALKFAQIGATKKAVDDPRQHGVYNPELHALLQKWEAAGGTAADDKPLSRHIAQSLQQYMENPHMKPGAPSAERQPLPLWRRVFARKEEPWVDNLDAFETLTLLDDLQPLQKRAKLSPDINDPQFNLVYPDYKPNYVMPQHLRKNVLKPEEALRVLHAMREMAPHGALDNTRLDWHGLQIKGYGTRVQNNDKITNLGRWLHHTTGDEFEATHPSKTQGFGDAFLPAANLVSVPSGMGGTLMHELGHAVDFNAFPSQSTPRHMTAAMYRNYAPKLWKEHAAWKKGKKTLLQAFADNKIDPQLTHRVLTNAAGAKRLGLGSYWGGAVGGTVGAGLSAAGLIGLMALLRNSGAGHVQIPGRLAALPVVLATMAGVAGGTGIGHLMARKPVASEKITKVMARALARKQGIPFAEAQRQIEEALNAKKTDNAKPLEKELKKAANASPAWQRSAGKNPEGGLNEKGRKSYERETGGNLKAPVTESNPKGERKARRSSFCARMGGMKKKLTSKATAGDPDSRINKALRKWNCKSAVEVQRGGALSRAAASTVGHVGGVLSGLPIMGLRSHVNPTQWEGESGSIFDKNIAADDARGQRHLEIAKDMEKVNPDALKDTLVYLGGTDLLREYARMYRNPRTSLPFKVLGTLNLPLAAAMANFNRGSMYNPMTNSVYIMGDKPSVLTHELGHALDFNSRPLAKTWLGRQGRGLIHDMYALARNFPVIGGPAALVQELQANELSRANLEKAYKNDPDKLNKIMDERQRILPAGYGSYIGNAIGGNTPFGTPAVLAGLIGGKAYGTGAALLRKGTYANNAKTKNEKADGADNKAENVSDNSEPKTLKMPQKNDDEKDDKKDDKDEKKRENTEDQAIHSKAAGVHGHFIHAVGLTPEERKYLNRQAARVAKWRQELYQAFLDRQTAEMAKLPPGSSNEGWEYRAGGSPNFRDDVLAAFQEKYPNANVWPGNAIEFQKRGPRRWLGLRAGKQLPVGEGYAVLMSHYPKEMMQNPEMDEYQPDYDVVTDFYGDVDSNVHDALNSITGGRYGLPTPKKTAAYKGISEFSGMPGPDQISHAVAQLGMLKALVRPDDSVLKQRGITRSGFQSGLRDIYNHSRDKDRFELSEMAPQPNTHAALGAAGGIGAAGLLGYAGVRNPAVLAGTAAIPAIAAYFRARHKRHNLLNTAKLVKDYGLLRPKLLRQAYPLLASDD